MKYLLCIFNECNITVNDLNNGHLLYNTVATDPIKLESEVAQAGFFWSKDQNEPKYWIAFACWEGKVAFVTSK